MKNDNSDEEDASLRTLLKDWKSEAPPPAGFQKQVWRRIRTDGTAKAPSVSAGAMLANWLNNLLPRPALAVGYVATLLALGASIGWTHAQQETARVSDRLSSRYVQLIDPYHPTP